LRIKKITEWIRIGRWNLRLWTPSIHCNTDGWLIMEGNKWEKFISFINSNPWYLIGLKKFGKYT
jgi:hypothetical protein